VDVKEILQDTIWIIAILGSCAAAFRAIYEMRQNRIQRIKELKWKQADAARSILHEIHEHPLAQHASSLMDWTEGKATYNVNGKPEEICYQDVLDALRLPLARLTEPRQVFIRSCMDWFFYYIDRIEHYIRIELIDFEGVGPVFRPYVRRIKNDFDAYNALLKAQEYDLAQAFLRRFDAPAVSA
jgi:hypothetical protein